MLNTQKRVSLERKFHSKNWFRFLLCICRSLAACYLDCLYSLQIFYSILSHSLLHLLGVVYTCCCCCSAIAHIIVGFTLFVKSRDRLWSFEVFVEINTRAVAQKYDLNVMRCSCEKKKKSFCENRANQEKSGWKLWIVKDKSSLVVRCFVLQCRSFMIGYLRDLETKLSKIFVSMY